MALVEISSSGMLNDISKTDSNIANITNGNNVTNVNNATEEKYELHWKGFEGNLIRYKIFFIFSINFFNELRYMNCEISVGY